MNVSDYTDEALHWTDRWRAQLFVLAGVLVLGGAILRGLDNTGVVGLDEWAYAFPLVIGLCGVAVGLVGLSPQVRETGPRLARTGVVFAVVTVLGSAVIIAWGVVVPILDWLSGTSITPWPDPWVWMVWFVALTLTLLAFGGAVVRSSLHSRVVRWSIPALAVLWIVSFVVEDVIYAGDLASVDAHVPMVLVGIVSLLVGYHLLTDAESLDREVVERPAESASLAEAERADE